MAETKKKKSQGSQTVQDFSFIEDPALKAKLEEEAKRKAAEEAAKPETEEVVSEEPSAITKVQEGAEKRAADVEKQKVKLKSFTNQQLQDLSKGQTKLSDAAKQVLSERSTAAQKATATTAKERAKAKEAQVTGRLTRLSSGPSRNTAIESPQERARVQRGEEGFSTVTYQGRAPTAPQTSGGSFGGENPFGAQIEHERHEGVFDSEHGMVGVATGDVDEGKLPEDFIHGTDVHQEKPREDRGETWDLNEDFDFWTGKPKNKPQKNFQKGTNIITGEPQGETVINGTKPAPVGDEVLKTYPNPEAQTAITDSLEPNPEIAGNVEDWKVNDDFDIMSGTHKKSRRKSKGSDLEILPDQPNQLGGALDADLESKTEEITREGLLSEGKTEKTKAFSEEGYDLYEGSTEERAKNAASAQEEKESGTAKEMYEPKEAEAYKQGSTDDINELRSAVGGRSELTFFRIVGRERGTGKGKYLVTTVPVDPRFMHLEVRDYGSQSNVKKARKATAPTAVENALKQAQKTTAATNVDVLEGSNTLQGEKEGEEETFSDSTEVKKKQDESGTFLSGIM